MKRAMLVASAGGSPGLFWARRTVALLVTAALLPSSGALLALDSGKEAWSSKRRCGSRYGLQKIVLATG